MFTARIPAKKIIFFLFLSLGGFQIECVESLQCVIGEEQFSETGKIDFKAKKKNLT